ncbi:polyprenol monophosphomannose synthase [Microbacterium sp. CJ77]|jgi:dolichol-phosphate mannosyltransferase|uniref:polyprenol monophosphomannose synthase n=1 Tax=Microbacterium sp. CJ77 TaxID=2079201 RepID=UPI000CD85FB2|nr:polyprenol monophosphomannose synthase [Microbacterium sp. CJ77]
MRTLVIVPTFNEAANILHTLDEITLYLPSTDVLVVDDSSPDGTSKLVAARALDDPRIALLSRGEKGGLGGAYRAGFDYARAHGYAVVIEMDADGSHPAQRLPALVEALSTADLVIGSRWMRGGSVVGWALHRRVLSRMASVYVRVMLGTSVRDATSGFRAFRIETLRTIEASSTTSDGYSFQIETLHRAHRCGLTVTEVPIAFAERAYGHSKMTGGIILEALTRVARWRRHPFVPGTQPLAGATSLIATV